MQKSRTNPGVRGDKARQGREAYLNLANLNKWFVWSQSSGDWTPKNMAPASIWPCAALSPGEKRKGWWACAMKAKYKVTGEGHNTFTKALLLFTEPPFVTLHKPQQDSW